MTIWHEIEKDGLPSKSGWYLIQATYGGDVYETTDYFDAYIKMWANAGHVISGVINWKHRRVISWIEKETNTSKTISTIKSPQLMVSTEINSRNFPKTF